MFSYNTHKIVMVRDRRLGLLYYGGLCVIVLYIIFYNVRSQGIFSSFTRVNLSFSHPQLLFEKKYLALDNPVGSFRFSLLRVRGFPPFSAP